MSKHIIIPVTVPIDMQILIAEFIPEFVNWSVERWNAGFRRFNFNTLPSNLTLCGPSIIVNDLTIRDELNKLSPLLLFPVVFEKNIGHKTLERIFGEYWEDLTKEKSIFLYNYDEGHRISIPPEIGQLKKLKTLSFSDCNINPQLPPKIGMLTNLVEFRYVGNERPMIIPKQIKYLTKLKKLTVETECIPDEISELKALVMLTITGNFKLSHIPELILPNLKELEIRFTLLRGCVPAWISRLPQLVYLDLAHNEFDSICNISHELDYLNISNNRFEELPLYFGEWFSVRCLDISNNMIEELPASFGWLNTMIMCSLGDNPLRVIPQQMLMFKERCNFSGVENTDLSEQDKRFLSLCFDAEDDPFVD
jgi:Leucine-rich repeat (LRR) protein